MLQTKELVKIYKPKKGIPVVALDKVSITFPEKGMVFLLGKSGSGKSTLLNVLGGLDNYNGGEIIIKGVSSKKFKQKHFDSYRNTYVGFIFQEYNVLDEFSVGANIALAIELQNRKAEDNEVNRILKKVDLEGYANRKPNELSGGQKQRVAIARALVKNPQIIMADEPSGALDSNTGKQIFNTLKKLSEEKLVIVVSHDREFAENYADRIIELADGKVISDVEIEENFETKEMVFEGDTIELPAGYHITEQDRVRINEYIESLKETKTKIKVSSVGSLKFKPTDISKIKVQDSSSFKLIKSKLPLKNAFKIGSAGLKHKKFRLVITILLSCISFGLFGLSDTFAAYNHINACTNSLIDTNVKYIATSKAKKNGTGIDSYWREWGYKLSNSDINYLSKASNVKLHGVYVPSDSDLSFERHTDGSVRLTESDYDIYLKNFSGFAEINENLIREMEFKILAGHLPDGSKDEIVISEYVFDVFKKAGYSDGLLYPDKTGQENYKYEKINNYSDIVGRILELGGKNYTVTGVIDTGFNIERYIHLSEKKDHETRAESLISQILYSEFIYSSQYSYSGIAMTGEGFIERTTALMPPVAPITEGYISFSSDNCWVDSRYIALLDDVKNEKILWVGDAKEKLAENEIIVSTDALSFDTQNMEYEYESIYEQYLSFLKNSPELLAHKSYFETGVYNNSDKYKIVGIIPYEDNSSLIRSTVVCCDSLYNQFTEGMDNIYEFAVGAMPKSYHEIKNMVSVCYTEDSKVRYPIQNSVTFELDSINTILKELSKIFLYIGLGFALFASVMLSNFIAISISYKKQEIGILRAIGSRSNDVFRIFFAESFIIAMINFILSSLGVGIATAVINHLLRQNVGILVTVLTFSARQVVLLFAVSVLVAFVASYLPVKRIASKRPIDAIRDK